LDRAEALAELQNLLDNNDCSFYAGADFAESLAKAVMLPARI
jgi:hypothetical protein